MPEDVEGTQALLKSMVGLTQALQKTIIVRSLRKAAAPIKEEEIALAPDDPLTPFSRIKESIGIMVSDQTATGAIAKIGPSKHGFMGIFAEEGTPHQRKTPFLGPAFDAREEQAFGILVDELGSQIEQAWDRN